MASAALLRWYLDPVRILFPHRNAELANNLAFRQVRHPSLLDGHCKRGLPLSTIQSRSYQHAAMYNVLHAFGAACVTHDRHAKLQVQDPENPRIP